MALGIDAAANAPGEAGAQREGQMGAPARDEDTLTPETPEQLVDVLRWAAGEQQPLEVVGAGTKRALGRPVNAAYRLALDRLSGITAYEPEELVLTARAATPMAEIEAALAAHNQMLAFEPADRAVLLQGQAATGGPSGPSGGNRAGNTGDNTGGTLGGAIACNLSGPRRIKAGAARDHLLGFHAVGGRGEVFKSGGRVVKNVTGFDLSKLITGSYGTLAVMTEVSVRALPVPEETQTVLIVGCDEERAIHAMIAAMQSPHDVSAAAHLPPDVATRSATAPVRSAGDPVTALRIEGPEPSVAYRVDALRAILDPFGAVTVLDRSDSLLLWREIADVAYFCGGQQGGEAHAARQVWRLSVPPTDGARVVAEALFDVAGEAFYDWGGGLVWLAIDAAPDAAHEAVRRAVAGTGGHATLVRAAAEVRARVSVFQPQPPPLAALTARVKQAFDPAGVLNPGRMYEGV